MPFTNLFSNAGPGGVLLFQDAVQIVPQGTFHISGKISISLTQTPLEYVSDDDHSNIGGDLLQRKSGRDGSGLKSPCQIIRYRDNGIGPFGADGRIQGLIFWGIIVRYKSDAQFFAVADIIEINQNNRFFCFFGAGWKLQTVRIDRGLFFYIIRKQIVFCLEMMIEAPVGYTCFFADVFDGECIVSFPLNMFL